MRSDGYRARHKYHSNLYNAHPRIRSSHIYLEIAACVPVGVRSAREINSTVRDQSRYAKFAPASRHPASKCTSHIHTCITHMHVRGDPRVHDRMHDIGSPTHLTRPSDPNKPRFAYDRSGFRFSSGAQSCLTSEGQGGAFSSSLPTSCGHVHGSRCAFANDNVVDR